MPRPRGRPTNLDAVDPKTRMRIVTGALVLLLVVVVVSSLVGR